MFLLPILAATIDYQCPGASVAQVLKDLSAKTGVHYAAKGPLQNEILILRVEGVTADQIADKIAEATHASWQKVNDGLALVRTGRQDRELREQEQKVIAGEIRKAQATSKATLEKQGAFDHEAATKLAQSYGATDTGARGPRNRQDIRKMRSLSASSPAQRALSRLGANVPAEALAQVPYGIKTVWSTSPTFLQQPCGEIGESALKSLIQEQDEWATTASSVIPPQAGNRFTMGSFGVGRLGVPSRETLGGKAAKLLFSAFRSGPRYILLGLVVLDAQGKTLLEATDNLGDDFEGPKTADATDPEFEIPAEAQPFLGSFGFGKSIDSSVRSRVLAPDKNEPLSFVAGPMLIAAAAAKKMNLVMEASDDAFSYNAFVRSGTKLHANQYLAEQSSFESFSEKAGWIVGQPKYGFYDREMRVNRSVLAQYIQSLANKTRLTIEQRAEMAAALPTSSESTFVSTYASTLQGRFARTDDVDTLRFYAALSPDQRRMALGRGLPLASLGPDAADRFTRILFGQYSPLTMVSTDSSPAGGTARSFVFNNGAMVVTSGTVEPTEVLRPGYESGVVLKLVDNNDNVAMYPPLFPGQDDSMAPPLTPQEVARDLKRPREVHANVNGTTSIIHQDGHGLRFADRRQLNFQFTFNPQLNFERTISDIAITNPTPSDYTSFPASFRDAVDRELKKQ
jgi:hypothetical protein